MSSLLYILTNVKVPFKISIHCSLNWCHHWKVTTLVGFGWITSAKGFRLACGKIFEVRCTDLKRGFLCVDTRVESNGYIRLVQTNSIFYCYLVDEVLKTCRSSISTGTANFFWSMIKPPTIDIIFILFGILSNDDICTCFVEYEYRIINLPSIYVFHIFDPVSDGGRPAIIRICEAIFRSNIRRSFCTSCS